MTPRNRSGRSSAAYHATTAPQSCPAITARAAPSASRSPIMSPTRCNTVYWSMPSGRSLPPQPRISTATARNPAAARAAADVATNTTAPGSHGTAAQAGPPPVRQYAGGCRWRSACGAKPPPCGSASPRRLALQHQPIEIAALAHVIIGIGLVDDAAVVPDHEIAVSPLVAVLVFRLDRVRHQFGDEIKRLPLTHADNRLDPHRVQIKRLAAVFGMGADQRMNAGGRDEPRALFAERPQFARAVFALVNVHRLQPVDPRLHRRVEIVIGLVHVDILGVTAMARQCDRVEHCRLGRRRMIGMVGVKRLARNVTLAGHRLLVRDIVKLRVARHMHLALVVLEQLAKDLGGGDKLRRRATLVADHQYMIFGKGAVQGRASVGVEILI